MIITSDVRHLLLFSMSSLPLSLSLTLRCRLSRAQNSYTCVCMHTLTSRSARIYNVMHTLHCVFVSQNHNTDLSVCLFVRVCVCVCVCMYEYLYTILNALVPHSHISGGCTGEYTDDDRDDTKKIALPPMCTCVCIHLCMQQI